MRKLLFVSILFLVGLIGKSQKVYFIYLESENAVPFYVKMGDRIYSSSPAGYLILSNLVDSSYGFSIGFARKREAEPRFRIALSGGDLGFLIKEQDQKLHLFDLQSLEMIAPLAGVDKSNDAFITRDDNFTRTLSLAVNDPTLMMEVVRKEPVKAIAKTNATSKEKETTADMALVKTPETIQPVVSDSLSQHTVDSLALLSSQLDTPKTDTTSNVLASSTNNIDTTTVAQVNTGMVTADTAMVVDAAVIDTVVQKDSVTADLLSQTAAGRDTLQKETVKVEQDIIASSIDSTNDETNMPADSTMKTVKAEYKRSTVMRHSESSTTTGFGLTYIDIQGASTDTIRLIIPNPKPVFKSFNEESSKAEMPKTIRDIEATAQIDTTTKAETEVQVDTVFQKVMEVQIDSVVQVDRIPQTDTATPTKMTPSHCKAVATDGDFKDLRKDMAALYTDAGMVNTAVAVFKEKCFSVEQVKNLSTLFLSDQWKYLFFEAIQNYVADTANFATLESEIKDEYYVNKFKALVAK